MSRINFSLLPRFTYPQSTNRLSEVLNWEHGEACPQSLMKVCMMQDLSIWTNTRFLVDNIPVVVTGQRNNVLLLLTG